MIELSDEQRAELTENPPRVLDPRTQKTCVLVSEEHYERIQALLAAARIPLEEQRQLLHTAALRAGWDDPEMEVYDGDSTSENQ